MTAGIDRARIGGILTHIRNIIVFDYVVVSAEPYGNVGAVRQLIVVYHKAHAVDINPRRAGLFDLLEADDFIVGHIALARCKGRHVAALHCDTATADIMDIAAGYAAFFHIFHIDNGTAYIIEFAVSNHNFLCILDGDAAIKALLDMQALDLNVGGTFHRDEWFAEGDEVDYAVVFHLFRRIQVEDAGIAIEIPLTRLVEFLKQIEEVETAFRRETVDTRVLGADGIFILKINRRLQGRFCPVMHKEAIDPDVVCLFPVRKAIVVYGELHTLALMFLDMVCRAAMFGTTTNIRTSFNDISGHQVITVRITGDRHRRPIDHQGG